MHKLIDILHKLADGGNSVIVIEHNLDMIKCADYIIDLGPEGGDKGGTVIAQGTPEEVAECEKSYTGQFLKPLLANRGLPMPDEGKPKTARKATKSGTARTTKKASK